MTTISRIESDTYTDTHGKREYDERFLAFNAESSVVLGVGATVDEALHDAINTCQQINEPAPESVVIWDQGGTILVDDADQIAVEIDGIEFTADKQCQDWGLMPEDNWPAVEAAAEKVGIEPRDFWAKYEPILNAIAGW